jgi:ribosomal protein L36
VRSGYINSGTVRVLCKELLHNSGTVRVLCEEWLYK